VLWLAGGQIADPRPREGALRVEGAFITGRSPRLTVKVPFTSSRGLTLVPAIVDAHVHLSLAGEVALIAREQLRRGVAGVLDLGAAERSLSSLDQRPLRARFAGPLFTAPGGYPTQTWGKDGQGLELSSPHEARKAVARLSAAGARFVKLAFDPRHPLLAPEVAAAASDEAHKLGLLVAAHALEADSVRRALEAGADVLAHTPRDALPPDLLERMKGKWVISTLRAFGVAPARLAALREAGARIAYGTDLGNEGTAPGIDARELELLVEAGVDPLFAATSESAELLGLRDLGRLSVGSTASLLAVRGLDPESLARPAWVLNCGKFVV
jgi:imidazolonepropionase-like amidohydrolase